MNKLKVQVVLFSLWNRNWVTPILYSGFTILKDSQTQLANCENINSIASHDATSHIEHFFLKMAFFVPLA